MASKLVTQGSKAMCPFLIWYAYGRLWAVTTKTTCFIQQGQTPIYVTLIDVRIDRRQNANTYTHSCAYSTSESGS